MKRINRLTLLGMSGVGKTHLAKLLSNDNQWFHYSADYRIGSKYLNNYILKNITDYMLNDKYLTKLIKNNSIIINNNINFDNLSVIADFLGKIGNPNLGGLPLKDFLYRQMLHLNAEKNTMLDVKKFINKANKLGIDNFINDAGGSLCELDDDKIYNFLADITLIIYIKANKSTTNELIKRAQNHPKPLYYNSDFLQQQLSIYLTQNKLSYVAQIDPDDFVRFIFPFLIKYRLPKYNNIANKYGIIIAADDLYKCTNSADFFTLVKEKCR